MHSFVLVLLSLLLWLTLLVRGPETDVPAVPSPPPLTVSR